jgi:hypothetical protein
MLVICLATLTNALLLHTHVGDNVEEVATTFFTPAAILGVIVSDGIYSVLLIFVFVHPIWKTTTVAGNAGVRTAGVLAMKKTSKNALVGGFIAVLSSTCLYINAFMAVTFLTERMFVGSRVLNPQLVGINVDSMLNDLVRLLGCGGVLGGGGGGVNFFSEGDVIIF